jgi:internalin A
MPEDQVIITEPAAVAALKHIYETNGPGNLEWDFSIPGQVTAGDGRLEAQDGALIGLDVRSADLKGILRVWDVETLTILYAPRNGLSGIDFGNLPGLRELDLRHNPPLAYLVGLTKLGVTGNGLTELAPLTALTSLTALGLDLERPTDLWLLLAGLPALTTLRLRSETIEDWSFLSSLPASINCLVVERISDLSILAGLTSLTNLFLADNQISDLSPLASLISLTELTLAGNLISDLSPLAGLTKLTCLDLGGNGISDLSPLAGLTELTYLDLVGNRIRDLSPLAGLTKLTCLDLESNRIRDLSSLAGLASWRALYLRGNQIHDLTPLAGLVNLQVIDIENCPVTDLSPLDGLPKLAIRGKKRRRPVPAGRAGKKG